MEHSSELLKSFANRLAQAAVSNEGMKLSRLLRLAGMLGETCPPVEEPSANAKAEKPANRVGIWERKTEDGKNAFVRRNDAMEEWHLWANTPVIEPKKARRRVALIGESVARGYLYDPQFNPAIALRKVLESQLGAQEVEVVDLARTNLKWEIRELAHQALLLEPDAVVIFAGNNWNADFSRAEDLPYVQEVLLRQGIPGLKKLIEERLEAETRSLVRDVASTYGKKQVPVVWMIPEFNLADWQDAGTSVPYLPDGGHRDWMMYQEEAQAALEKGEYSNASALAHRMMELDGGVNAHAPRILAECSRNAGDPEATRFWLEKARDATIWDVSRIVSPRCYSAAQKALREETAKYPGSYTVDLPAIFKEYQRGEIADRQMFLDFCHLTVQGIEVAVAAAAASVLKPLTGRETPWRSLLDTSISPDRQLQAEGAFLAAIHNAHHHQCEEVVRHHCLMAITLWPKIARTMAYFVELQTRRTPMLMCTAAEQIAGSGSALVPNYLLRKNTQQLDAILLDAIGHALKKAGVDLSATLSGLRRKEHSVAKATRNLLDYYYCSSTRQSQEIMWAIPRDLEARTRARSDYYKAYGRDSKFLFVGEKDHAVKLEITCRVPGPVEMEQELCASINGQRIGGIAAGRKWETWEIVIPGPVVREGLNEIAIRWPLPAFSREAPWGGVTNGLPEFFPVFGEIHSLTAGDGQKIQNEEIFDSQEDWNQTVLRTV